MVLLTGILCLVLFAQTLDCKPTRQAHSTDNHNTHNSHKPGRKAEDKTADKVMNPTGSLTTRHTQDTESARIELNKSCQNVIDLATDVANTAEQVYNLTCKFPGSHFLRHRSCLEHTLHHREHHSNFSRLELVNTTTDNTTSMLSALYRGVVSHHQLMKMVTCTSYNLECGIPLAQCEGYLPTKVHVDRQPQEYCTKTTALHLHLYGQLNGLRNRLEHLPFFVNISEPKKEDLTPYLAWTDTGDRVSDYLMSIYNTYQQATHIKDIVNQLCHDETEPSSAQEHPVESQPQVVVVKPQTNVHGLNGIFRRSV